MKKKIQPDFWKEKSLSEMSYQEWESLCDGCGKCCVLKLQDIDSEQIFYTDVCCRLLDCETAKCSQYDTCLLYTSDAADD